MRCLTGENYETEFPKDADMKPPRGFNTLLEAFSSIRHQLELEKYGDHE